MERAAAKIIFILSAISLQFSSCETAKKKKTIPQDEHVVTEKSLLPNEVMGPTKTPSLASPLPATPLEIPADVEKFPAAE